MQAQRWPVARQAVLHAALGLLACLVVGYAFLGRRVLVSTDPSFQFLIYGAAGGILYAVLRFAGTRHFLYTAALFLALEIVAFRTASLTTMLGRGVYLAGLALAVFLYHRYFEPPLRRIAVGKFLILGGIFAAVNLLIMLLATAILEIDNARALTQGQTFFGFLIGCGLCLGFEMATLLQQHPPTR